MDNQVFQDKNANLTAAVFIKMWKIVAGMVTRKQQRTCLPVTRPNCYWDCSGKLWIALLQCVLVNRHFWSKLHGWKMVG